MPKIIFKGYVNGSYGWFRVDPIQTPDLKKSEEVYTVPLHNFSVLEAFQVPDSLTIEGR